MKKKNSFIPNFGKKGWGIALLGICFYYMYQSVFDAGLNTLLDFYHKKYNWSTTQVTFFISLGGWLAIAGIVIFGALCKKKGAKFVSILGLLGVAASFPIIGFATTLPVFAAGVILYFIFAAAFGIIGVGQFGANWFPTTKGMYMGIVTEGITIASATINLLMNAVIPVKGISFFMMIFAAAAVVLALLTGMVKNYPEQAGAYPDNDRTVSREELAIQARAAAEYKKNSPWNTKKLLSTREIWTIGIGWGLPMLAAVGIMSQLTLALVFYGHDFMFGIILLSSMWPVGVLGNYLGGVIDEKFGTKAVSYMVVILEIIATTIILAGGTSKTMASIGVALFMFTISAGTNVTMSITTTVFGRDDFENAWPIVSVFNKVLMSSGPFVIALFAQASYNIAFVSVIIMAAVALVLMIFTPNRCITSQDKADLKKNEMMQAE